MTPHILVVDDDPQVRQLIADYLGTQDYRVSAAADGGEMARLLAESAVDLIVLDLKLPGEDGLSLARKLRAGSEIPIIMLTGQSDPIDRIVGLELGADDYLTKPFNPRELLARVKSLLRRTLDRRPQLDEAFSFSGWTLNLQKRRLIDSNGREIALTRGEFEVLSLLVRHAGESISRDRLSLALSGREWDPNDRSVDVLVRRLRAKLDVETQPESLIATVRGEGYRLAVDPVRVRA